MRQRALAVVTLLVILLISALAGADDPERISGQGGFPLTDSVTSMWATVSEPVSKDRPKPLTFMIYFVGKPDWHKGKWSISADLNQDPASVEFSGPVVLRAEYNRKTQLLRIFEKEFSIVESNVIMVQNVDNPERRQLVGLGRVDLNIPPDANPAIYVLGRYEDIRNAVLKEGDPKQAN